MADDNVPHSDWLPIKKRRLVLPSFSESRHPSRMEVVPLFPRVELMLSVALHAVLSKNHFRILVRATIIITWLGVLATTLNRQYNAEDLDDVGPPIKLSCGSSLWLPGNQCGIDGHDCRPFANHRFAFTCPANCADHRLWNPRTVGNQNLIYTHMVVGGSPGIDRDKNQPWTYRGDSQICVAAVHNGTVSNAHGGCGIVNLVGERDAYTGSHRNGINSSHFDSSFPLSFMFEEAQCRARDSRWMVLLASISASTLWSFTATSPVAFFWGTTFIVFWHVGLVSDPPAISSFPRLFSVLTGRFFPMLFTCWTMYEQMGVKYVLSGLSGRLDQTILWLGGCWLGAHENYTLRWIPIQRLTPHDIHRQPGALFSLIAIIALLSTISVSQLQAFAVEGRAKSLLKRYLATSICLAVGSLVPQLHLRIHHYILALILIPGTAIRTRRSLLYQGILVGLFINGIARWGWDPVLQTSEDLRGDGPLDSIVPQLSSTRVCTEEKLSNITFSWETSSNTIDADGMSVLVNDVERFRAYFDGNSVAANQFTWSRQDFAKSDEFFRFGYLKDRHALDYTNPGTWTKHGEWVK
ncbi:hypothetical protein SNOG_12960 [Parastagonospora nodorum SN15]|uniref:LCCL domain-containing protein n=2 Tax=Phaeosphaeria nodorum (strain SN15 / ATCC MYA-4574 / FGSC 10173) TaxID=321614 RepID=Q0U5K4_PHANO|nr:hypothetical protein SNOG_12960 [Parastagonospora nodorum SN15]EAT79760.1 hypothetical protein SNOG_12960 [Parastagonospora nodorum SN15]